MKAAVALSSALVAEGVDVTFGLLGGGTEELVDAISRSGVRFVSVRHEQAAVGMADGYSRATGRVGVAIISHGPGLANAATPMVAARKARSRVLVITSDLGAEERFTPHGFEQELFLRATVGRYTTVKSAAVMHLDVASGFSALRRGDGPVALNVPANVFGQEVADPWPYEPVPDLWSAQRAQPDPVVVAQAAGMLADAKRPLIIAGRGAVLAGARSDLLELARRSGAALATTLLARGWFDGQPGSLGLAGGFGDPRSQEIMRVSDLVLAFGASLSRYTTDWGSLIEDAVLIRVDHETRSAPEMNSVSLAIWADAGAAAAAIARELAPGELRPPWIRGYQPSRAQRAPSAKARELGLAGSATKAAASPSGERVDPRRAVEALDALLPRPRGLVVDAGNAMGVAVAHFGVADPLDQIFPWEFGAIGGGMAVALGAALGRPDRPTVAFVGDGSFMLSLADAEIAARHPVRLLVVVTDDGGFRSERGSYLARGLDATLADYENPDIAELARTLGYESYVAASPRELEVCLQTLAHSDPKLTRPTLIVLKVDRLHPNPEIDRAFANYRPY